jgi:hypothetical protein
LANDVKTSLRCPKKAVIGGGSGLFFFLFSIKDLHHPELFIGNRKNANMVLMWQIFLDPRYNNALIIQG